jgi:TolB-like protein/DNA-binding winged helix-turn-helix (wHTH) protein
MRPNSQDPALVCFGAFELDLDRAELRKGGAPIRLKSQQLQLLALLASRAGQVVSREEIRAALWDQGTFVDFDQSINVGVNQIRGALGDDPQTPCYIETLPRKGYRFIAPIIQPTNRFAPVELSVSRPNARRRWWLLLSAGTVAAIVFFAAIWVSRIRGPKPIESLAVLPLENLSHDPEQDYFADGMTDELITDLAKISALRVISRTSVMQYKGTKKPVPEIARELNVDALLEGSVTRDRDRVRITAQLVRAEPEKHLWAEKYEGNLGDVLAMQDEVAKSVAREIQIKLTPREKTVLDTRRAVDPVAYESYLKGRYLWERPGEENLQKSLEYFERAIAEDPGYSRAWSGLAAAYARLAGWGALSTREALPRARAAAERARELDGSLAEPFVSLASVKANYEWDWAGVEQLLKRALELNPRLGYAHHVYATYLAVIGRTSEAVAEARRAHEVEPLAGAFPGNVVWKLYLARQYREAEAEADNTSQRDGYIVANLYLKTGRQQEAMAILRKDAARQPPRVLELMYLGHGLGVTGAGNEGRKVLAEMQSLAKQRYVPPEYFAVVYEGLGEREQALRWFEKAYAERSMNIWILPDPQLDGIRAHPRFQKILRGMGLLQ